MKHWIGILLAVVFISSLSAEETGAVHSSSTLTFRNFEDLKSSSALKQNRDKLIMVHFWGTWCPPCLWELPDLLGLAQTLQKELTVILIALKSPQENQEYFLNQIFMKHGVSSSNVMFVEEDYIFMEYMKGRTIPRSYLFDQNGNIILKILGSKSWLGAKGRFVPNWWPFAETWKEFFIDCYMGSEDCSRDLSTISQLENVFLKTTLFRPSDFPL